VLAALRSEPVREPEEVSLVDRVQDSGGRPLYDLVLKGGNCEGALPSVRFGDVDPSGWQGPIRSSMKPCVQVRDIAIEIRLVGLPCQPIHSGCGILLELKERRLKVFQADVMQERGELLLRSLACHLSYAIQRLGHASPVLSPARALLCRIPLGLRPSLPRLRSQLPGFVRRSLSYYGGV
jgi:hypothetical protein